MAEVLFSDQRGSELRPVVIISRNSYNENFDDVVICGITTNSEHPWHVLLRKEDLEYGEMLAGSGARTDMITRVLKSNLRFKIAKINDDYHKRIAVRINDLIG